MDIRLHQEMAEESESKTPSAKAHLAIELNWLNSGE
jgi:hypothetical protein